MRIRAGPLLITLITVAVFAACVVLLWPAPEKRMTTPVKAAPAAVGESPPKDRARTTPSLNPAAQKAGPPDPAVQHSAATAAEKAAQAAAELATK